MERKASFVWKYLNSTFTIFNISWEYSEKRWIESLYIHFIEIVMYNERKSKRFTIIRLGKTEIGLWLYIFNIPIFRKVNKTWCYGKNVKVYSLTFLDLDIQIDEKERIDINKYKKEIYINMTPINMCIKNKRYYTYIDKLFIIKKKKSTKENKVK